MLSQFRLVCDIRKYISNNMEIQNLTYNLQDLEVFTPQLQGWRLYVFTLSTVAVAIASLVAQTTVYRSLKRMGSRPINQMILPSQVIKFNTF